MLKNRSYDWKSKRQYCGTKAEVEEPQRKVEESSVGKFYIDQPCRSATKSSENAAFFCFLCENVTLLPCGSFLGTFLYNFDCVKAPRCGAVSKNVPTLEES